MKASYSRPLRITNAQMQISDLLTRRQTNTSFFLSINTAIAATIGLLMKDSHLSENWLWVSVFLLLLAGSLSTWIWRSLLNQYETSIGWWYSRLREMESSLPEQERLITREYDDLYSGGQPGKAKLISMTGRERTLTTIFMALYVIFALGVIWTLLR